MNDAALAEENQKLRELLGNKQILKAISFMRLQYISHGRLEDADDLKQLHTEIYKVAKPPTGGANESYLHA